MRIRGKHVGLLQACCLFVYYCFAQYLPISYKPWGKILFAKQIRAVLCRVIFKRLGQNVNIERKVFFGLGVDIEIGDNSGIGVNCHVPDDIKIGNDVMMGPNCYIFARNHRFDRVDIPMWQQGYSETKVTIIDDDVWIGQGVTFTPGRHVSQGTVIGACTLLCKDFPEYSIVGGNPARLIRVRK